MRAPKNNSLSVVTPGFNGRLTKNLPSVLGLNGQTHSPSQDQRPDSRLQNIFTVDLEDWFHGLEFPQESWAHYSSRIETCLANLLELLSEFGVHATFFVLGPVAEQFPDAVRELARAGHEVGTHGYSHDFVYRQSPQRFALELRRSKDAIEPIIGRSVVSHRAAFFSITCRSQWALQILVENGIRFDSSVFPVVNYRYGMPGAPRTIHRVGGIQGSLIEFPPSTVNILGVNVPVCGGAYFRILPYCMTRLGIRHLNRMGQPVVFYIHPWELDRDLPRVSLPRRIALTHYWNQESTGARLRRLLAEFKFGPLTDLPGPWSQALDRSDLAQAHETASRAACG